MWSHHTEYVEILGNFEKKCYLRSKSVAIEVPKLTNLTFDISPYITGKAWVPKTRVDPIIESVTLEPELEEALSSASDAELCDIAGNYHTTSLCRLIFSVG